jgi:hypothetical protein
VAETRLLSTARPTLGTSPPSLVEDRIATRPKAQQEKRVVQVSLREQVGEGGLPGAGGAEHDQRPCALAMRDRPRLVGVEPVRWHGVRRLGPEQVHPRFGVPTPHWLHGACAAPRRPRPFERLDAERADVGWAGPGRQRRRGQARYVERLR